MTKRYDTLMI